jgi:hypothetical protein
MTSPHLATRHEKALGAAQRQRPSSVSKASPIRDLLSGLRVWHTAGFETPTRPPGVSGRT